MIPAIIPVSSQKANAKYEGDRDDEQHYDADDQFYDNAGPTWKLTSPLTVGLFGRWIRIMFH